ncbi:hypothetical protein ACFLT8_07430, partial [Chloroflexota bacterium]
MQCSFTPEREQTYLSSLEEYFSTSLIDYRPDEVTVNDLQALCLPHYIINRPEQIRLWRCHIDTEETSLIDNINLLNLINDC